MDTLRRKTAVAWLSVVSNTTLVLLKFVIGLLIGSVSVISEAIHSAVDLVAAAIALFAVKTAGKPADEDHPYGHGKIENISGTIEAILIFGAAGWIIYEAVEKLRHPHPLEAVGWGIGVMLFSALANLFVSHMLFKVGRETDSLALQADAWHLRTDVWTSFGVMAGLSMIWIGSLFLPDTDLSWLDPVSAIAVALLIIKAAWDLTRQAAKDLLDARLPLEEEEWIRKLLVEAHPQIRGFHHLRTRKSGPDRFVDLHLVVDGTLSVSQGHNLSIRITREIEKRLPNTNVTVHIDPCGDGCSPVCIKGCLMSETERMAMDRTSMKPEISL